MPVSAIQITPVAGIEVSKGIYQEIERAYCRHCEEHDNKLVLIEHRMTNDGINEASKSSTTLFKEQCICSNGVAVDCTSISKKRTLVGGTKLLTGNSFRRQKR